MPNDVVQGFGLEIDLKLIENLQKIDEHINKIAENSEKMKTVFNGAMSSMTTNADELLKKLESISGFTQKLSDLKVGGLGKENLFGDTQTQAEKVADSVNKVVVSFNKLNPKDMNIVELTKEIKELNDMLTKGDGVVNKNEQQAIVNRRKQLEKELKLQTSSTQEIAEQEKRKSDAILRESQRRARIAERDYKRLKKTAEEERRLYETSTKGSLEIANSKDTDTYAKRARAIKNLEIAIKNLHTTDKNYQNDLRRLTDAHKRLTDEQKKLEESFGKVRKSQSNVLDTAGQLARKLALVFSISQIQGYLMNIVKVTGEFEKQNVALASILQNKNEADKLFGQITELAVKSPFQLKELITYTKQLSAYQIESEKLYDTTKRLADVSAGLGVDVGRLILAFGQVKAANYLRGTEVRQFTEAGLNILGELAKYYSELEGRMVSVGEVQEMVTKRMVAFGDVEEIFKRITSAGGIFYEMQEKQAKTLAGQISNLSDSIDIMLNSIGQENYGTIKFLIDTIKSLVDNWKILANVIKASSVAFVLYAAKTIIAARANNAFAASAIEATIKQKGLLSILARVISSFKSMGNFVKSNPFILLASAAAYATFKLIDHNKELEKNRHEYDILVNSVGDYGKEVNKILSDIEEQNKQIRKTNDELSNLSKGTSEYADKERIANDQREKRDYLLGQLKSKYPDIYDGIVKQKDGTDDLTKAQSELNKELELTSILSYIAKQQEGFFSDGILENIKESVNYTKELDESTRDLSNAYEVSSGAVRELVTMTEGLPKGFKESFDSIDKGTGSVEEKTASLLKLVRSMDSVFRSRFQKSVRDLGDAFSDFNSKTLLLSKNNEELRKNIDEIAESFKKTTDVSSDEGKKQAEKSLETWLNTMEIKEKSVRDFVEQEFELKIGVELELDKKTDPILGEVEKRLNKYLSENKFELIPQIKAEEGLSNFFKKLKDDYKNLKEEAEKISRATQELYPNQTNAQRLEDVNRKLKQVIQTLKDWGEFDEKKKRGGSSKDPELERLKQQISLIKKASDEYKKLLKYYSQGDAENKVKESFQDAFSDLGLSIDMEFDNRGVIKSLESLYENASEKGKKEINKALSPVKAEIDIEVKRKQIEDIKSEVEGILGEYQLKVELDQSGLDVNELKGFLQTLKLDDEELDVSKFNVKTFEQTLEELRAKKREYEEINSEESIAKAEELQKEITGIELGEAKSRLKELASLREKYLENESKISYLEEQVKGWKDALDSMDEASKAANKEQVELLRLRIANGEFSILKLKSESLQLTKFWRDLFGDLEHTTTGTLKELYRMSQEVIDSISELKQGDNVIGYISKYIDADGVEHQVTLTVSQYQRLLKQNNKLSNELIKKNPFKFLINKDEEKAIAAWEEMSNVMKDVSNTVNSLAEDYEQIFGNMSQKGKDTVGTITEILDGMSEVSAAVSKLMNGDIIGGTLQAMRGLSKTIAAFFRIGDKKKEREIQNQINKVEKLQEAYERLQEAMDKAYSLDSTRDLNNEMNKNLEERNKALEKARKSEEDKKKKDKDKIKEYQKEIEENNRQIIENNQKMLDELGGFSFDSQKSAAEGFVDAWLDAFVEVGDGLQGLEDNFDDFFKEMIKKQLLARFAETYFKGLFEDVNRFVSEQSEEGEKLTPNEISQIAQEYLESAKGFDEAASELLEQFRKAGVDLTGGSKAELDGLQRGIKGITEEQADALTAITESIRYFSADTNAQIRMIASSIINPPIENPYLVELKNQTRYMQMMYSLWSSLSATKSGASGKILKVQIV